MNSWNMLQLIHTSMWTPQVLVETLTGYTVTINQIQFFQLKQVAKVGKPRIGERRTIMHRQLF